MIEAARRARRPIRLLAEPDVVAERACGCTGSRATDDAFTCEVGDNCAGSCADKGAVGIGRVDALRAAGKTHEAKAQNESEFLRHVFFSVDRAATGFTAPRQTEISELVAALADAGVVAKRTGARADERAGSDVLVKDLGDGRTGQSAAGSALRVGRHGRATVGAGFACGKTGDQKSGARKTEDDGVLHSSLPV
ncbi:hypothetical protein [Paracoccus ravus]|uniref:hypothetical protein n=1 Tax=Paracoccus ravus TaxID=2447760 RepID=UPI00142F6AE0|nr:hypothetical protein [Paracoccus ravus]